MAIRQWYNKAVVSMPGTLFVVATPIGNLEDITARALRVLREVAVIAAEDTRRTAHLLARYAISTSTTSLHEHNETQKAPSLIARLLRGDSLALVSDAGTPAISDPGRRFIRLALDAGIRVESIPGPNAAIAALAVSGVADGAFTFMGFPPSRSNDRNKWVERAREIGGTIVFYEAPHRIRDTLAALQRGVGDCRLVVCRELTKAHEEMVIGPISSVLAKLDSPIGEFTVVAEIGHSTTITPQERPSDAQILDMFGHTTDTGGIPRRRAVNILARQLQLPPNEVYEAIERAKKSVK
jgi:16S rRNA (cytidine1402-2'-O)-methyltransferase